MNTITRNIINDNFVATELRSSNSFNKVELSDKINFWKFILKYKCQAKSQESIVIGNQTIDINYFAIIFAAAELSLKIVIIDYIRSDKFKDHNYIDPKTEVLSPIDIFLHDFPKDTLKQLPDDFAKFSFFTKCSKRSYSIKEDIDFTINEDELKEAASVYPKPTDIIIRTTSSGTTETPKVIEHTHEFIYAVSIRNKQLYNNDTTAVHVKNLNHGASAAVTLFPVLASDAVTQHLIYGIDEDADLNEFVALLAPHKNDIAYMSFPYPYLVDKFIAASNQIKIRWTKLTLVTLSYILESARLAVRDKLIKSVVSIFGATETIGPIFTNVIKEDTWDKDPRYFNKVDNFYGIQLSDEGKISVTPPVYNTATTTNDYFKIEGEYFVHQGRSDLIRINGEKINLSTINSINNTYKDSYVVVDTLNHCLYIALWKDMPDADIVILKQNVESHFNRIKVTKVTLLETQNFYYGIKLDNELLREYFRNHIN